MAPTRQSVPTRPRLCLLDAFDLNGGSEPVVLPQNARRLLALLALRGRRMTRAALAPLLWPGEPDEAALGALRSALYRLRKGAPWSVVGGEGWLQLNPVVAVDVAQRRRAVAHLQDDGGDADVDSVARLGLDSTLLPSWEDPWVEPYRRREEEFERHARDCLAERLAGAGREAEAVDIALVSIARDPLWERPYRIITASHLRAGNPAQAILMFEEYRRLCAKELGAAPSKGFYELLASVEHVPDSA